MHELRTHLEGNTSRLFRPEELNHVLLMVYGVLRRAVLDESDTLRLSPTRFTWYRQNRLLGEFRIDYSAPSVSFREALRTILARDSIVRRHLQLVTETPEELSYRIEDVPLAVPA